MSLLLTDSIPLAPSLSSFVSLSLSPSQSCCFGCFDINVTMTPPCLIRKYVQSCNGFWEHEPATAASDMPGFTLSLAVWIFLHSNPFLSPAFSFTLIFCSFFYYLLCTPVAPALFVSHSFTFPPSSLPPPAPALPLSPSAFPPPLSVLRGVGFSGSESCFALKNSLS